MAGHGPRPRPMSRNRPRGEMLVCPSELGIMFGRTMTAVRNGGVGVKRPVPTEKSAETLVNCSSADESADNRSCNGDTRQQGKRRRKDSPAPDTALLKGDVYTKIFYADQRQLITSAKDGGQGRTGKGTDLRISCDDGQLFVHRAVVQDFCPFLKDLLQGHETEEMAELIFPGYKLTSLKAVLTVFYMGWIPLFPGSDKTEINQLCYLFGVRNLARSELTQEELSNGSTLFGFTYEEDGDSLPLQDATGTGITNANETLEKQDSSLPIAAADEVPRKVRDPNIANSHDPTVSGSSTKQLSQNANPKVPAVAEIPCSSRPTSSGAVTKAIPTGVHAREPGPTIALPPEVVKVRPQGQNPKVVRKGLSSSLAPRLRRCENNNTSDSESAHSSNSTRSSPRKRDVFARNTGSITGGAGAGEENGTPLAYAGAVEDNGTSPAYAGDIEGQDSSLPKVGAGEAPRKLRSSNIPQSHSDPTVPGSITKQLSQTAIPMVPGNTDSEIPCSSGPSSSRTVLDSISAEVHALQPGPTIILPPVVVKVRPQGQNPKVVRKTLSSSLVPRLRRRENTNTSDSESAHSSSSSRTSPRKKVIHTSNAGGITAGAGADEENGTPPQGVGGEPSMKAVVARNAKTAAAVDAEYDSDIEEPGPTIALPPEVVKVRPQLPQGQNPKLVRKTLSSSLAPRLRRRENTNTSDSESAHSSNSSRTSHRKREVHARNAGCITAGEENGTLPAHAGAVENGTQPAYAGVCEENRTPPARAHATAVENVTPPPEHAAAVEDNVTPPEHAAAVEENLTPPEHAAAVEENLTPPEHAAAVEENLTPPEHAAAVENLTPPEHAASVEENLTPPEHAAAVEENLTPPEHTTAVEENVTPPAHAGAIGEIVTPPSSVVGVEENGRLPSSASAVEENRTLPTYAGAVDTGGEPSAKTVGARNTKAASAMVVDYDSDIEIMEVEVERKIVVVDLVSDADSDNDSSSHRTVAQSVPAANVTNNSRAPEEDQSDTSQHGANTNNHLHSTNVAQIRATKIEVCELSDGSETAFEECSSEDEEEVMDAGKEDTATARDSNEAEGAQDRNTGHQDAVANNSGATTDTAINMGLENSESFADNDNLDSRSLPETRSSVDDNLCNSEAAINIHSSCATENIENEFNDGADTDTANSAVIQAHSSIAESEILQRTISSSAADSSAQTLELSDTMLESRLEVLDSIQTTGDEDPSRDLNASELQADIVPEESDNESISSDSLSTSSSGSSSLNGSSSPSHLQEPSGPLKVEFFQSMSTHPHASSPYFCVECQLDFGIEEEFKTHLCFGP